ncbi:hypothetical protein E2562_026818 [Oryza meyeriana var. granulata]|uniref:Uncharacterized protein n=1 Tax=Oryza meyeriana var. granulata TaxID=110450 RepID=A0A6G1CIR8_9ORYZ|nr:hypothetical protein E2562_026818 [Oryza meyeriana var. granulata]
MVKPAFDNDTRRFWSPTPHQQQDGSDSKAGRQHPLRVAAIEARRSWSPTTECFTPLCRGRLMKDARCPLRPQEVRCGRERLGREEIEMAEGQSPSELR